MSKDAQVCSTCGDELPHATIICVRNLEKKLAARLDTRALEALDNLHDLFLESHQEEIEGGHGGDDSCSYCDALKEAKAILDEWRGGS